MELQVETLVLGGGGYDPLVADRSFGFEKYLLCFYRTSEASAKRLIAQGDKAVLAARNAATACNLARRAGGAYEHLSDDEFAAAKKRLLDTTSTLAVLPSDVYPSS